jgi:hypothetical protein
MGERFALPDRQPSYVASWNYLFDVLSLPSLVVLIATGWHPRHEGARLVACHGRRTYFRRESGRAR